MLTLLLCQKRCNWYMCNQVSSVPVDLVITHVRLLRVLLGKSLGDVIPRMVDKLTAERQLRPGFPLPHQAHIHACPGQHSGTQPILCMLTEKGGVASYCVAHPACSTLIASGQRQNPLQNEGLCCRNVAGQIAQVQAELQAAQAAALAAARAVEAARAEDREAKQIREQAVRGKKKADNHKNAAESQLDELTSQQPEDADTTNTALQDALKAIFDKNADIRLLQQKVTAPQQCLA